MDEGNVICCKGDIHLVDVIIPRLDSETSSNPKFSRKSCFWDKVKPNISSVVGPGRPYKRYILIIQGDNNSPHTDGVFNSSMIELCRKQKWHWELQGPEMPFMNNLKIAVFPTMAKHHSILL